MGETGRPRTPGRSSDPDGGQPCGHHPHEHEESKSCLATTRFVDWFAACQATGFAAEILIVDNGSTDSTPEILQTFAEQHRVVRVVHDAVPGKSGAINRGLSQAEGDVIIFTDDDVHVPESWVTDMAEPILEGRADAVGGLLHLASYLDRPWFTARLRQPFAELLDVSGTWPGMVGASMAASKTAALAVGFDEELGPGARGFADDVLFNLRLKSLQFRLIGSSGPPAVHHLDEDRLTYVRLVDLALRNGSSTAYLWHHWMHSQLRFVRLRVVRNWLRLVAYRALHRRRPDRIDEKEFVFIEALSFGRHLLKERKRVPNY